MKKILFFTLSFSLLFAACEHELTPTEIDVIQVDTLKAFSSSEIESVDENFNFSAEIPVNWTVAYVPEISALSFLDTMGESKIFVRTFSASQFLTLNTVDIFSREESTINGRPALTYEIQKRSEVENFPKQPLWRNERHFVTDIRSNDDPITTFYVFAKNPSLPQEVFDAFLDSVTFNL